LIVYNSQSITNNLLDVSDITVKLLYNDDYMRNLTNEVYNPFVRSCNHGNYLNNVKTSTSDIDKRCKNLHRDEGCRNFTSRGGYERSYCKPQAKAETVVVDM
jgi:hypothetical protein